MMGSDAREMLGLPSTAPAKPVAPKAAKPKGRGPSGIAREVMDLKFEGAPPISIVAPRFKDKPRLPFKPRRWAQTPFGNSARTDGLVLRHWKREGDPPKDLPTTPAETQELPALPDSVAAKWNLKISRPVYSDAEYDAHLASEDWTRAETDYLVDLAVSFDLRWIVVADRYDYPSSNRSMEDMKARYYRLAAKCMALRTPLSSMSSSEFDAHEKMSKFDPQQESMRKKYVERIFHRTPEEAHEEEMLLRELSRIVQTQDKLAQDRHSIYDRLEAPPVNNTAAQAATSIYQSSQGLNQLMQTLLQQLRTKESERREKRRSALGIDTELDSKASKSEKRPPSTPYRNLSTTEKALFGVSYPSERLNAGVSFRHERIHKAAQAKSSQQTTRISDALGELGIPPRLFMPTSKVVAEYESLIDSIRLLVDVRKVREKLDGEIRVWEAQKALTQEAPPSAEIVEDSDDTEDTRRPSSSRQNRKRSASVASSQSPKRRRR